MDLLENLNLNLDILETYFNNEEYNNKPVESNYDTEDMEMKYDPSINEEFDIKEEFPTDESSDDDKKDIQLLPVKESGSGSSSDSIDWPKEDLDTLIKRIELALPETDNLAHNTRAEKLNWDELTFKEYSAEDCKKTWLYIQKRVRRFRLLSEVLQDAKEWVSKPWRDYYRRKKTRNCPDMPRRPLSAYMLYYVEKKDEIHAKNPGFDTCEVTKEISQIYRNLPAHERDKYTKRALNEKKNYQDKLNEYYRTHPTTERERAHQPEKPAKIRQSTLFYLFYKQQLKGPEMDNMTFKEECKKQWKILPDKNKLTWINLALEAEAKYQDELKTYMGLNPDFAPPAIKPVINKEEKALKERLAGKPVKPPCSAYALFTAMMLQSEEIKKIPPKGRMKAVADEWKNSSDAEKTPFQERIAELTAQYKEDFALYLESLPEFERREVEAQNAPKRKFKNTEKTETNPEKKKKSEVSKKAKEETNIDLKEETTTETKSDISIESVSEKNEVMAIKEEIVKEKEMVIKDEMIIKEENKEPTEEINIATVPEMNTKALQIKAKPKRKTIPEKKKRPKPVKKPKEEVNIEKIIKAQPSQPPISGLILFTRSYKGPLSAKVAWKGLPEPKREEYEEKVKKMRHKYIVQYEQFLRSLSREELFAFSNSQQKDSTDASDSEVKEDSSESDDSSSDIE